MEELKRFTKKMSINEECILKIFSERWDGEISISAKKMVLIGIYIKLNKAIQKLFDLYRPVPKYDNFLFFRNP